MISEQALELLLNTARKAGGADALPVAPNDRERWFAIDGGLRKIPLSPPMADITICDVKSALELARHWAADPSAAPSIWHYSTENGGRIDVIRDSRWPVDRSRMSLRFSDRWLAMRDFRHNRCTGMTQDALIDRLRDDVGLDEAAIAPFRSLNWTESTVARQTSERTAVEMGNSINAAVSGIEDIPASICFSVPVYVDELCDAPAEIDCAVALNFAQQRIRVIPGPDALTIGVRWAHKSIHGFLTERLADSDPPIPVYYGEFLTG